MLYFCVSGNSPKEFPERISLCFTAVKITKTSHKKFLQSRYCVCFSGFRSSSWNIRKFLTLWLESSISRNIRNILRVDLFHFSSSESYFLKYKRNIRLESSISGNIRTFHYARVLNIPFLKYRKSSVSWNLKKLFLRKYKKLFQSREIFWGLGWRV